MSKWFKENIANIVVGVATVVATACLAVLGIEVVVGVGLLLGFVWAPWRLGSRRTKKAGLAMATLVVVGVVMIFPLGAPEACADGSCQDKTCVRDLPCLVSCPPCNGSPFDPGTCWYAVH